MKIKNVLIFLLFFVITSVSYINLSKKLPVSYYDEEEWVGTSCYLELLFKGDFDLSFWDTYYVIDQSAFTRILYGVWIYPVYLTNTINDDQIDYIKFLINHGFNYCGHVKTYSDYKEKITKDFLTLEIGETNFPNELVDKYGPGILKNIGIIQHVRILSAIFLSASVLVLFIFFFKNTNPLLSIIFYLGYGFNFLLISNGLLAHSEALFVLFFNLSIIQIYKYLNTGFRFGDLMVFSIFVALCFSTKLNGIMPYFIFVVEYLIYRKNKSKTILINTLELSIPLIISVLVFCLINPYTYSSPLINLSKFIYHRFEAMGYQSVALSQFYLPTVISKIKFILDSLINNYPFMAQEVRAPYLYKTIGLILFTLGIISETNKIKDGSKFSRFMLTSSIMIFIITVSYIPFSWPRYLIQLTFIPIYYGAAGILNLLKIVKIFFIKGGAFHNNS